MKIKELLIAELKKWTQKLLKLEKRLTDHNHNKYITTPEFNTSATVAFDATLAQANLVIKTDFDAKLRSLNKKF